MQTRGECGSARPQMRSEAQIVSACDRGDPHRFGDSAADCEVGLKNVDRGAFGEFAKIKARKFTFASRNRNIRSGANCGAAGLIVGRYRLFEPSEIAGFDESTEPLGFGDGECSVRVAHETDLRSERLPGRLYPLRRRFRASVNNSNAHLYSAEPAALDVTEELPSNSFLVGPAP